MNNLDRNKILWVSALIALSFGSQASEVNTLLEQYASQGASQFSATRGQQIWEQTLSGKAPFTKRSCTSCHSKSVLSNGKHIRTTKLIEPMAPSANPARLSDAKKVEKWFTRNCKWTFGRVCTPQEKGDIITYLNTQ